MARASFFTATYDYRMLRQSECRLADTRMVNRYCLFVLEIIKAWIDPTRKNPRTVLHLGRGRFTASGRVFKLPSI